MSMISDVFIGVMFDILREFMSPDGIIVLSGDFMQLNPVSGASACRIITRMKEVGELYVLNFIVRYRSIQMPMNYHCTSYRSGDLNKYGSEKDMVAVNKFFNYLKTIKTLSKEDFSSNIGQFADYTFLTYTNTTRRDINRMFKEHFGGTEYSVNEILISDIGPEAKVRNNIRTLMMFDEVFKFKIGMHVMFCATDYNNYDYINGEHGIITGVTLDASGGIDSINVEKTSRATGTSVDLKVFRRDFTTDTLKKSEGYDVHYQQFPLELAHAMTIHKSQGSGYDKLIIDMGGIDSINKKEYINPEADMKRCRLFYTALTRTVDTDHLYFYGIDETFFNVKKEPGSNYETNRRSLYKRYINVPIYDKLAC